MARFSCGLLRLAAERRVEGAGALVVVEADVGGVGQAGIDQRPVEPAAGVVADDHGQRVGGVAQRRIGRRAGRDQEDVLLGHLVLGHDLRSCPSRGGSRTPSRPTGPVLQSPQLLLDQLDQLRASRIAGRGDGDVRRHVAALEVGVHLVARQGA